MKSEPDNHRQIIPFIVLIISPAGVPFFASATTEMYLMNFGRKMEK